MRILAVIECLARYGAERSLVNLLPALHRRGHRCEVAVMFPPYDVAETLEGAGIVIHRLSLNPCWNAWHAWEAVRKITALCRRGRFDVVDANLFFAELCTALSRPFAPSPLRVVTSHAPLFPGIPCKTLWKKAPHALFSWLMRHWIDGWVAVSRATARDFEAHFGLRGVVVIPNAFQVEDLNPLATSNREEMRSRFGVLPGEFVIVTPGRLSIEKGHRFLLQALVTLRGRGLRPKLLIFGDGPLANQTAEQIATFDLRDQVMLRKAVPHDELMGVLAVADACVFPSTQVSSSCCRRGYGFGKASAGNIGGWIAGSR